MKLCCSYIYIYIELQLSGYHVEFMLQIMIKFVNLLINICKLASIEKHYNTYWQVGLSEVATTIHRRPGLPECKHAC